MILFNRTLSFAHTAATSNGLAIDGLQQEVLIFRRQGFGNTTTLQDVVNYAPTTTVVASNYTLNTPLEIVSSLAADTLGGAGAHIVRVSGILSDGLMGHEDVTLAGTTPVPLLTNFRNVNSAVILQSNGSNGLPAGLITLRGVAAPKPIFLQISLSTIAETSLFTVPANAKAVITNLIVSVTQTSTSALTRMSIMKAGVSGVFVPICDLTTVASTVQQLALNLSLSPLDTIKISATPSANNNFLRISGSMEVVLIQQSVL